MNKVSFPINKHEWSPSVIPGAIVLISTYDDKGNPHFAPKSWIQMVAFEPPTLMFSGSEGNATEQNILVKRGFVVNVVDSSIADKVYSCIQWGGLERVEKTGFHFKRAEKVNAPAINECKAHIECKLIDTKQVGSGFVVFGEIVSAAIWDKIADQNNKSERYKLLSQVVFQENGLFSTLDSTRQISPE